MPNTSPGVPSANHAAGQRIAVRLAQYNHAVNRVKPHIDMMLDHDQRFTGALDHMLDGIMDFLHAVGIEIRRRLVKEQ